MHLILTGATGLVGTAALRAMLSTPEVTRISILSRRPVAMADVFNETKKPNKNVQVLIHTDSATYEPELLDKLKGATGCVWALGIPYRMSLLENAKNKEVYVTITHTWPVAAARAFATLARRFNFVYVSGEGATQTPSFLTPFFGRVKGDAETSLLRLLHYSGDGVIGKTKPRENGTENTDLGLQCHSVRPGFVDAAGHDEIRPYVPQPPLLHALSEVLLGPIIRNVIPSMHSPTTELGKVLVQLAGGEGMPDKHRVGTEAGRIFNANTIRTLATGL